MTELITFPEVIDNTMRKELIKCHKAAHYRFEQGLESVEAIRVDLVAGGAYAKGLEVMRRAYFEQSMPARKAVGLGVAAVSAQYGTFVADKLTTKTVQRMAGALAYYEQEFPLDQETIKPFKLYDGRWTIECQFVQEIPLLHPTTNLPLKYAGRFDMLGIDENGKAWVVDEKTTSQMGDKWSNQWFLDSQITGYCWGARKLLDANGHADTLLAGAYINGIAIRKYDYEAKRLPVFREDWEIERWYEQMLCDVQAWKRAFMGQDHSMALDHACAYYLNPCQFTPLCKSRNPERLVDGSFVVRRWDPTERDFK